LYIYLVTLVVVVDPIGLAPIFVALTRGVPERRRRVQVVRGVALGAGILFVFAFVGDALLEALGIGLPAFRIAGGALLFLVAVDIIFGRPSNVRPDPEEQPDPREDIAVFPLAIPLIAGPGALATVLLYTGGAGAGETVAFLGVLALVLILTLFSLLLAPRIMDIFGATGSDVFSRVLGVLLAALAVQFVLDGIIASLPG
jgi:multiple antibiotic resistance protein